MWCFSIKQISVTGLCTRPQWTPRCFLFTYLALPLNPALLNLSHLPTQASPSLSFPCSSMPSNPSLPFTALSSQFPSSWYPMPLPFTLSPSLSHWPSSPSLSTIKWPSGPMIFTATWRSLLDGDFADWSESSCGRDANYTGVWSERRRGSMGLSGE